MLKFTKRNPHLHLRNYIRSYWMLESEGCEETMYLLDPRFNFNIRDISDRLEYYDQSHLLKDFKAVMGQSPSAFLQRQTIFSEPDLMSYLDQWDYS